MVCLSACASRTITAKPIDVATQHGVADFHLRIRIEQMVQGDIRHRTVNHRLRTCDEGAGRIEMVVENAEIECRVGYNGIVRLNIKAG